MKLSALIATTLLSIASSAPTSEYAVHEKRNDNKIWTPRDVVLDGREKLPLAISLTQRNLDKGYEMLMDVSDGNSENYGKHWSAEKVKETFAPSEEAVSEVKAWLRSHGIDEERLKLSNSGSWIRFESTVSEAEDLMQTKYKLYEHAETKKTHIACDEYSLPAEIKAHIDFITPTIDFGAVVHELKKTRSVVKRDVEKRQATTSNGTSKLVGHAVEGAKVPLPPSINGPVSQAGPTYCDQYITPECLRALYGFPLATLAKSSYGIVEFTPQAYLQNDMNLFYASLATYVPQGYAPTLASIDGGVVQTTYQSFAYNGESDLDLQYAIALVYPQKVTLYQVGDMVQGASFNNFLDALDASYCTFDGGDDPKVDPIYPSPYPGGYKGPKNCGGFTATSVISISYAYNEADLPTNYMNRQCNEYMKLGLQGVTIVVSSGDHGVAGNSDKCCTYAGCSGGWLNAAGKVGAFNPSFPGTCPYITSIGATQITPGSKVSSAEVACETVIYSGGGFSNNFALPAYQSTVVDKYFKKNKPKYAATIFNTSGKTRGLPDISANGANYLIAVNGQGSLIYGTSASAPVIGGIITLINEQRINAGKKPVGFINPVLYANPKAFNDIKKGNNPGCGTTGFSAVSGWDPVTGLGTPIYSKLLAAFMALP